MCEEMATEMADDGVVSLKQETVLLKDSIKLERMKYADTTCKYIFVFVSCACE